MDNRKITIFIAERDLQTRLALKKALALDKAYNIIGMAEDNSDAEEILEGSMADIVLLNADSKSVSLLKTRNARHSNKPVCIVTVEPFQQTATRESLQSGADYFLMKPINMDIIACHLKEIYFFKHMPPYSLSSCEESRRIAEFTVKHLNRVHIGSHLKGYHYLITGIVALIENETMKNKITKELYPCIAKKWHSTPVCVERAMRNAINTAWENGGCENFKAVAGSTKIECSKPSNSQFMMTIARLYHAKYYSR